MDRRRRFGRVALMMTLVVTSVLPASAQTTELRAVEGNWSGFVSFISNNIPFRGSFEFVSAAGELEGSFQWASSTVSAAGVVSGPDTRPRFDLTSIVSSGIDVPDVTGGGEIEFTAATCERLEGTGVFIDVSGRVEVSSPVWWAVKSDTASDLAPFFNSLEALRVEVNEVLDGLESGAVILEGGVIGRIEPLVAEAESLASGLDRSEGCGIEFYRSVVASEVERLLLFALANPDLDVFTLGQILLTAVRAGVIGSGGEVDSSFLDTAAYDAVAGRIADAVAAEDTVALIILSAIAEDMGWADLEVAALVALTRLVG